MDEYKQIAKEFVHKYYTALNESPCTLYLFCNSESSFTFGGLEHPDKELPPAVGQDAIYRKLKSLNLVECRTRVNQLDSQRTTNGGILILVAGEMSQNMQPPRTFMQTFVLCHQNDKKYCLVNSIFRYLDEIFRGEEADQAICDEKPQDNASNEVLMAEEPQVSSVPSSEVPTCVVEQTVDITDIPDERPVDKEEDDLPVQPAAEAEPVVAEPELAPSQVETAPAAVETVTEVPESSAAVSAPIPPMTPIQNEIHSVETTEIEIPKVKPSWASLAANMGSGKLQAAAPRVVAKPVQKPEQAPVAAVPVKSEERKAPSPKPQRPKTPLNSRSASVDREGSTAGSEHSERAPRYPDNQQVFVGNLPRNLSDEDLKKFLEQECGGHILEMRIHHNGANSKTPNFGFVTFASREIVQELLKKVPIFYYNHRINVEEKKRVERPGSGRRGRGGQRGRGRGTRPTQIQN